MKIIELNVVTNDPSRLKPYVFVRWDDDRYQQLDLFSTDSKTVLKGIQDIINIRLNPKNDASKQFLFNLIQIVNPKEKVTDTRLRQLRGRLHNYKPEEIETAAIAFSKSEWHKENHQMTIDNLLAPSKFGRWHAAAQEMKIPVDDQDELVNQRMG